MAYVVVSEQGAPDRVFRLARGVTVVGRSPECELCLPNVSVSRHHARLVYAGGEVRVEEIEGCNPVLVDGRRVSRQVLRTGQELRVGKYTLHFLGDDGAPLHRGRLVDDMPPYLGPSRAELGAGGDTTTFILSPAQMRRLRETERTREDAVLLDEDGRSGPWRPGESGLVFGRAGEVPVSGFAPAGRVAAISWDGGAHVVEKLSGWVGLWVNDAPVKRRRLEPGDRLRVGRSRFRYELEG